MARAYAHDPEAAPCSWVPQTKHAFAFQQLLFRDDALRPGERLDGRPACGGRVALQLPLQIARRCRRRVSVAPGSRLLSHAVLAQEAGAERLLAAWAPLVVVDAANGGVEYAAGSHAGGFRKHHRAGGFLT